MIQKIVHLKHQGGLVLLNAIFKISNSSNFNITDIQTGLASLVKLGLVMILKIFQMNY